MEIDANKDMHRRTSCSGRLLGNSEKAVKVYLRPMYICP